ncbi:hypothetical protein F4810DRAFT_699354 [Camillea tinctor]|nr:hypothetical protein F4810DRAFT_699354 [Camillea tinctor]
MAMNVNQEGYNRRLAAVQQILHKYGLESTKVTPIAYVEHCPFHFNNFIYKVDLASPATPATFSQTPQPCTVPPPAAGVSSLVVRMSNPKAEGLNNASRVENDVAAQHVARASVRAAGLPPLVPAVYAWTPCRYPDIPDETGFGWTLGEFKEGADLDGQFSGLSLEDAKSVVEQLAAVFTAVQKAELPSTVTKFGALTLDAAGNIVSGQTPLLKGGPWDTYADFWVARLQAQLSESNGSSLLKGWADGGVRERIDTFMAGGGVQKILGSVDVNQKVLVHGDLTMNNVLYDSKTKRITALLDFDWSTVSHPCDEFLTGLWDIGGGIHERNEKFLSMVLKGDFSVQPEGLSDEDIRKWEVAKAWDAAITKTKATRPSDIAGVERIEALRDLEDLLCPFVLASDVMLRRISDEDKAKKKQETADKILSWLNTYETLS